MQNGLKPRGWPFGLLGRFWAAAGLLSGATIDSTLPFSRTFEVVEGPVWTNRACKSDDFPVPSRVLIRLLGEDEKGGRKLKIRKSKSRLK